MADTIDLSGNQPLPLIKYRDYDGSVKVIDPKQQLAFGKDHIPYETQAITFYTVTQLTQQASRALEDKKLELTQVRAGLYRYWSVDEGFRQQNGGKKPTEAMIQAQIDADEGVVKVSKEVNQLKYQVDTLKGLSKAFEQRKDLMQSVSAEQRLERQIRDNTGDPLPNYTNYNDPNAFIQR